VNGYIGNVNGTDVAILVFTDGVNQGKVATAIVPSQNQLNNWGIGN